jgi:hypothetical protein
MSRVYNKVKCQICNFETFTNGIATHITNSHKITVEEYISKYGEYRPKYIKYQSNASEKYSCKICGYNSSSERHLTGHIRSTHSISKIKNIILYTYI